ncbi:hypothetical protein FHK02_5742 [Spirosoma sp. LMG 31448]|uniref:Uncharacterized protein n=1 Tax=Spirosoma utsteinense TaxID=2585773 RepID=A0ABR6WFM2_9BACT|nr:hypothetical protein [Spirosoma utsteinense]MBC3795079.1 hypothetical protein [Spirosoma utsteinense]
MPTIGEILASNLQELIELEQITLIRIYIVDSEKLCSEDSTWAFNQEFIKVDYSWYNLNRIHKYECTDTTLSLHFLAP